MNNEINNFCRLANCECKYIEDVARYAADVPEVYKQLLAEQAKNKKLVEALENAKGTIRFAFRTVFNTQEDWLNFWEIVKQGYDILEQALNEANNDSKEVENGH